MVVVAQLVRASVCGTEGRGFEPHLPPKNLLVKRGGFFIIWYNIRRPLQNRDIFRIEIDLASDFFLPENFKSSKRVKQKSCGI